MSTLLDLSSGACWNQPALLARPVILKRLCGSCDCRDTCLQVAMDNMYVNDQGEPEAFFVQAGYDPHELVEIYEETVLGDGFLCFACGLDIKVHQWSFATGTCKPCS